MIVPMKKIFIVGEHVLNNVNKQDLRICNGMMLLLSELLSFFLQLLHSLILDLTEFG